MKSLLTPLLAIVAVVSLIGNYLLWSRWSSSRPLVTIGGDKVTRKDYQDALDFQSGQAVLTRLVFSKLVRQTAAREGVMPTSEEVDVRLADVQRRAPQTLVPYSQDPVKMEQFKQDLETEIALENLRIKGVSVTPQEVAAYYAAHLNNFKLPTQVKATTIVTENSVDADTAATLLRQNTPPDVIGRQPRLHVAGVNGFNPNLQSLPAPVSQKISKALFSLKPGQVTTIQYGKDFLTFQVTRHDADATQPLAQVRDQVTRLARMQKAPSAPQEMAMLYQAAKPQFTSDRYAAYFSAIQSADTTKK